LQVEACKGTNLDLPLRRSRHSFKYAAPVAICV
jgi:hypothetical protein